MGWPTSSDTRLIDCSETEFSSMLSGISVMIQPSSHGSYMCVGLGCRVDMPSESGNNDKETKTDENDENGSHRQKYSTYRARSGDLPSLVGAEDQRERLDRDLPWTIGLALPSMGEKRFSSKDRVILVYAPKEKG
ncbi:hypothetical protein M9H77_07393 [Catharanthus roseus]|uniref:Uncharacterized protein n=1 Tax=Catharanthus roseus TaxID=4058 RepID=A0ACC0BV35_CATRO|nr:hypothetical protein M9H77_07393 [Catharanthus roseus]